MKHKSRLMPFVALLSATFLLSVGIGCNGSSEDYASKQPESSVNNPTGTFSAAGSTFIAPLFSRWSDDYEKSHQMRVNYRPIGSGAALSELKQGLLTFAASDAPLTDGELKDMPPLIQVPVTAGPVCVTYNLPGITQSLRLSGKTLAGIYAGQIKTWQDPAIERENPGIKLPQLSITVVHRLDGSGTTSIFTSYLGSASPSWSVNPGHGLSIDWPTGIGQNGSKGIRDRVMKTAGSIGYLELSYAKAAGLPVASIQNKAGEFIAPSPASAALAIGAFNDALSRDLRTPIVDPSATAKGAYPITGLTFIIIPKKSVLPGEQRKFKDFVTYCLTDGQISAEEMSYTKLPATLQQQGLQLLSELTENGKPLS